MGEPSENTKYVKIFILIIFFAAIISLIYKGISTIRSSTFQHESYNLLLIDQNVYVVHIDKSDNSLASIKIPNKRSLFVARNRLSQSLLLSIPIDGVIISKKVDGFSDFDREVFTLQNALPFLINPLNYKFSNVNSFDIMKFSYYARSVPKSSKVFQTISQFSKNGFSDKDVALLKKIVVDKAIFNNKASLQIINTTDIDGLASRFSNMLKNAGYNIVSIDTGKNQKSKIIAKDLKSDSVKRLRDFLDVSVVASQEDNSIADITIILRVDMSSKIK